jgi:hypothetical protein
VSHNYSNTQHENCSGTRLVNGRNEHVFIYRVWCVSAPHGLYCTVLNVPAESTRGHDLAQAIDIRIQRKRGCELTLLMLNHVKL